VLFRSKENLETMAPQRLRKNPALNRALLQRQVAGWGQAGKLMTPTTTLPIDTRQFEKLFQFIAKGLIRHHWQTYLTADHFVRILTLTGAGDRLFDERLFNLNARSRVSNDLGNGTVSYQGAQAVDCSQVTVWRIWIYGGLLLAGGEGGAEGTSARINVATGPKSVQILVQRAAKHRQRIAAHLALDLFEGAVDNILCGALLTIAHDDVDEATLGTDPLSVDSDGDGILTKADTSKLTGFDMNWDPGFDGDLVVLDAGKPVALSRPMDATLTLRNGRIVTTHLRQVKGAQIGRAHV